MSLSPTILIFAKGVTHMMCDVEEENAISSRAEPDGSFGNLDVTVTNHNNLCAKGVTHMMCDVEEENAISSFDKEHIISTSNLTAASELCERLTTLTERWECELMFHEIPSYRGATTHHCNRYNTQPFSVVMVA
jgi:hypothetical protein